MRWSIYTVCAWPSWPTADCRDQGVGDICIDHAYPIGHHPTWKHVQAALISPDQTITCLPTRARAWYHDQILQIATTTVFVETYTDHSDLVEISAVETGTDDADL